MAKSKSELGDTRLERVHGLLIEAMSKKLTVILRQLSNGKTEEVAFHRFINNDRITPIRIVNHYCKTVPKPLTGKHMLVIEDSSTLSFGLLANRSGLGRVGGKGTDKSGFVMHPSIFMNAEDGGCHGLGGLKVCRTEFIEDEADREARKLRQRDIMQVPFEEKERYKWYSSADQAITNHPTAKMYTIVGDREADIYDLFARYQQKNWQYVIRSAYNRRVYNADGKAEKLYATLEQLPVQHTYEVDLPKTDKRSAHCAELAVKFGKVSIIQPQKHPDKKLPKTLPLYVVEVKESPDTVVNNEKPVHWVLFTSHPVENTEMAMQIVQWYRWRWVIEQVFRTLKLKGLNIEESTVESYEALANLATLALIAAVQVLQLTQARNGNTDQQIDEVFSSEEQQCLTLLNKKVEGNTALSKNPHPPEKLAFAAWIIARLGGWKGYKKSRPPGPITFLKGFIRFNDIFQGFYLLL